MDPYALLGLSPGASEDDVRGAYRELMLMFHPDHQPVHLRDRALLRTQFANDARERVLADIATRSATSAVASPIPRQRAAPVGEDIRVSDDEWRRWRDHQAWLAEQRRIVDEWSASRVEVCPDWRTSRSPGQRRRRAWVLAPLVITLAFQLGLVLGAVFGLLVMDVLTSATGQGVWGMDRWEALPQVSAGLCFVGVLAIMLRAGCARVAEIAHSG